MLLRFFDDEGFVIHTFSIKSNKYKKANKTHLTKMRRILLQEQGGKKNPLPESFFCLTISNENEIRKKKNREKNCHYRGIKKVCYIKYIPSLFIHIFIPHQIYNNIKLTFCSPEALHRYKHNTQVLSFAINIRPTRNNVTMGWFTNHSL